MTSYNIPDILMYANWGLVVVVWSMAIESIWQGIRTKKLQDELEDIISTATNSQLAEISAKIDNRVSMSIKKLKYQILFSVSLLVISGYRFFT